MSDQKLCFHHVGARSEELTFPHHKFADDVVKVLYDADADCLAAAKAHAASGATGLHIAPYAVGGKSGQGSFNINYDPNTNSLLKFNDEYSGFYGHFPVRNNDYLLSEAIDTVSTRAVDIVTMDSIFADGKDTPPPFFPKPDFLAIDTQGSEYEILTGARNTITSSVLGISLEAEFEPIYEGQKLFGDISGLLSELGFYFVDFLHFPKWAPARYPIGLRDGGFLLYSDALFLRKIDNIESKAANDSEKRLLLRKLGFISILNRQTEYGLACLEAASRFDAAADEHTGSKPTYMAFLDSFHDAAKRHPRIFPVTFRSLYKTHEDSQARFTKKGGEKDLPQDSPRRYKAEKLEATVEELNALAVEATGVEKVLDNFGLAAHALSLKSNRLAAVSRDGRLSSVASAGGYNDDSSIRISKLRKRLYGAKTIALFGATPEAAQAMDILRSFGKNIPFVVDNDPGTRSSKLVEARVISPEKLPESGIDFIIVASRGGYGNISKQLQGMGYSEGEHYAPLHIFPELIP